MIRNIEPVKSGNGLKVLSYNVLAQCLVRREQYPTSGRFLRWGHRSKIFAKEITKYSPDILLLQEVDADHRKFWRNLVEPMGFHIEFHSHPQKKHGLAICYKPDQFGLEFRHKIELDKVEIPNVERQCETNNVALFLGLKCKADASHLLVGTSHFYWHPDASYERSRQFLSVLSEIEIIRGNATNIIFGGDFNSEYFDPPYLLMTNRQMTPNSQAAEIMQRSIATQSFDKFGDVKIVDGVATTLPLDKGKENANSTRLREPELAAQRVVEAFSRTNLMASSFYAKHHIISQESAADYGEPLYTNWTEVFKGTLDYLFCIHDKNKAAPMETLKLLKVPSKLEIGELGLPQPDKSPSDHICIMAEISSAMHKSA